MEENINENYDAKVNETKQGFWKKLKFWQKAVFVTVAVIIISIIYTSVSGKGAIDIVKNGNFLNYKQTTVGKAFDNFFGRPKWEHVKNGDDNIVKFTGKTTYDNKNVTVTLEFDVDTKSGEWEVDNIFIDDNSYGQNVLTELLKTVYKNY